MDLFQEARLLVAAPVTPVDVCVVVHNQPEFTEKCLASVKTNCPAARLFVWDNASAQPARTVCERYADQLVVADKNEGFVKPCNRLARMTSAPVVAFLNSDAEVKSGWDRLFVALLEDDTLGVVGTEGGWLNKWVRNYGFGYGHDIDYVCGWSFAMTRKTYARFGVFDENNIRFAYCDDSDLSLRVREAGLRIYATRLQLAVHHGSRTIADVVKVMDADTPRMSNQVYLSDRWGKFLETNSVVETTPIKWQPTRPFGSGRPQ